MGLRSLPFFKAKKGWMFAGGGQSADGGGGSLPIATTETLGGVRVGSGLEITNDGVLSALSFPVPSGYRLVLETFTNITLEGSTWAIGGNIGTKEPLFSLGNGFFRSNELWCGFVDCKRLEDGTLQFRANNETVNGYPLTVYTFLLERM